MKSFFATEFDKLLIAALLVGFCAFALRCGGSPGTFAQDMAKEFVGALLMLITGNKVGAALRPAPTPPTPGTLPAPAGAATAVPLS